MRLRPLGETVIVIIRRDPSCATPDEELAVFCDSNTCVRSVDLLGNDALATETRHLWKLNEIGHALYPKTA